ncbi:SLC13 family permease [Kiritimatiellaeota bacterium B1221]|nr:SLC13 family permease [Kiritimatiellaeota bacterium B1221]
MMAFLEGFSPDAWLAIAVVTCTFLAVVFTRLPTDVVFMGGLAVLVLTGVLNVEQALAGFSSPAVVTVGLLYIVVAGVQETGGLNWISTHILGQPKSYRRAQIRLTSPVVLLSAFLNNTPVVALFIPTVMEWCRRINVQPSKLLIPLSYASIFGGLCTLIGTSTNLVVNGLWQLRYGETASLGMFEIAKIGVPCALLGLAYLLIFYRRLPDRRAFTEVIQNPREYTLEMRIAADSPLIAKTIEEAGLRNLAGVYVAELLRGEQVLSAVSPKEILQAEDRLLFVGNVESIQSVYSQKGLAPASEQIFKLEGPRHHRCLVETVVSDTCPLVGRSIREGRFRQHYNAVVIAVARNGSRVDGRIGDIVLKAGDTLLVESHAGFLSRQKDSRDFYLISTVEGSTPPRTEKAPWAFTILGLMVFLAAGGWFSMLKASMLATILMLVSGCCNPAKARRHVEWHVLLTIAAALGLGVALESSGAASTLANGLLALAGGKAWLTLLLVYLLTAVSTELMTNNAAAALVFPIAMNSADHLGASPLPFVFAMMIAASASFMTPIGYQTNLMVYGPGGYRFGDFARIGFPLALLFCGLSMLLIPIFWPF